MYVLLNVGLIIAIITYYVNSNHSHSHLHWLYFYNYDIKHRRY